MTAKRKSLREGRASQKKGALELANDMRHKRAILRRKMKLGTVNGISLINGGYPQYEEQIAGWKLSALLKCIPRMGPLRIAEVLDVAEHPPHTRIRDLSFEKRKELAGLVEEAVDDWSHG